MIEEHREEPEVHNESIATWEDRYAEYLTLSEDFRRELPFKDFCESQYKVNLRGSSRMNAHNFELRNFIGKIYFPYFYGSSKCTASSWIQKLDTYFQLNPMDDIDAIKMATLHIND